MTSRRPGGPPVAAPSAAHAVAVASHRIPAARVAGVGRLILAARVAGVGRVIPAVRVAGVGRVVLSAGVLAASLGLIACGKSERTPGAGGASAPATPVTIDLAAVNALVPAALKDRLVFERRELVIQHGAQQASYVVAAPAGWIQTSKLFAHLRPAGATATAPRFDVGSNCDGPCTPRPWEAIADRVNFAPRARGKVLKDERSAGRRTMIAQVESAGARTTDVVVAWWADGDKRYHVCTAVLDDALRDAAPAFDRACQAVAATGDD